MIVPAKRAVNGILLLDKPTGISSNHALQKVKRIYHAKKAGHTGALDPLATGMLPICFGEATKFSQLLLDADKFYRVTARLGERTNTSDVEGEVIQRRPVNVTITQIEDVINRYFLGKIKQIPSMFSALKYQGKPLYDYARKGIEIEREPRDVTIYHNRFISLENNELTLDIHCSKGTYVRTIIDDLGELLQCGAHVIALRRTQIASYPATKMLTLELLEQHVDNVYERDNLLLPVERAVQHLSSVYIAPSIAQNIQNGQSVQLATTLDYFVGLNSIFIDDQQKFIGVGYINEFGQLIPKRLINEYVN